MLQNATWFPRRRVERLGGGSGVGGEVAVAERGMVDEEGDTGDEGLSREDPLEGAGGIAIPLIPRNIVRHLGGGIRLRNFHTIPQRDLALHAS